MNDRAEKYRQNYKQKSSKLNTLKTRKTKVEMARKNTRNAMFDLKRNLDQDCESLHSVKSTKQITEETKVPVTKVPKKVFDSRKKDIMKSKPAFKVCRVQPEELYSLENAYKYIKGRPVKSSFAPTNHVFKPPNNVKPINFKQSTASTNNLQITSKFGLISTSVQNGAAKLTSKSKRTNIPQYQYNLRSKNKAAVANDNSGKMVTPRGKVEFADQATSVTRRNKKKEEVQVHNEEDDINLDLTFTIESPDVSKANPEKTSYSVSFSNVTIINDQLTPDNKKATVDLEQYDDNCSKINYRKTPQIASKATKQEMKLRQEENVSDEKALPEAENKPSADFFLNKLNAEIARIINMCDNWDVDLKTIDLPENAHTAIAATIGMSKLLISQKFQQFRGLIDEYGSIENQVNPISVEDLHGFWDMIYIQVENINFRFDELKKLKENNWNEQSINHPVTKKPKAAKPKSKKVVNKPASNIRNFIKAARKQQQPSTNDIESNQDLQNDCTALGPDSQIKQVISTPKLSKKISRISSTLNTPGSPGLTTLKIACSIKQRIPLTPISATAGSCSKFVNVSKSEKKDNLISENKENIDNSDKTKTPRRSIRLARQRHEQLKLTL